MALRALCAAASSLPPPGGPVLTRGSFPGLFCGLEEGPCVAPRWQEGRGGPQRCSLAPRVVHQDCPLPASRVILLRHNLTSRVKGRANR